MLGALVITMTACGNSKGNNSDASSADNSMSKDVEIAQAVNPTTEEESKVEDFEYVISDEEKNK